MHIREIITESNELLYHKTRLRGLLGMLKSGRIDVSSPENIDPDFDYGDYGHVSLTRDPEWYHFADQANEVTIVVDAQALRDLADVKSHAWQSQYNVGPASQEQEERIAQAIPFNNKYIRAVKIDFIDSDDPLDMKIVRRLEQLDIPVSIGAKVKKVNENIK